MSPPWNPSWFFICVTGVRVTRPLTVLVIRTRSFCVTVPSEEEGERASVPARLHLYLSMTFRRRRCCLASFSVSAARLFVPDLLAFLSPRRLIGRCDRSAFSRASSCGGGGSGTAFVKGRSRTKGARSHSLSLSYLAASWSERCPQLRSFAHSYSLPPEESPFASSGLFSSSPFSSFPSPVSSFAPSESAGTSSFILEVLGGAFVLCRVSPPRLCSLRDGCGSSLCRQPPLSFAL